MVSLFKKTTTLVVLMSLLVACAGRSANPTNVRQPGDERLSCQALSTSMHTIETEVQRLIPESQKTGKNVALGVAGAFFLFPWFFMDFSEAEKAEINAYRMRYNHLMTLYTNKKCAKYQSISAHTKG